MLSEHSRIVLTTDLPEEGLACGDVGTIVHVHPGREAFVVEFMGLDGGTVAVATVLGAQARPVTSEDITHARRTKLPV